MLTFTRKPGQMIRIGDNIRVTVKEIRGKQARIAIEAPKSIAIYREEVYLQIVEENKKASQVPKDALDRLV